MSERPDGLDPVWRALRERALPEPSSRVDARVRAEGRRAYERAHRGERGALPNAALAVILAAIASVYLGCALDAANALYR